MIKIKNTTDHSIPIVYNEAELVIPAFQIIEVDEVFLGKLPKGIRKLNEEKLLGEIDPYTDKTIEEISNDNAQLLNEGR